MRRAGSKPGPGAVDSALPGGSVMLDPACSGAVRPPVVRAWRIRLAAYGARLERVLGSRPRGFKSPILRFIQITPVHLAGVVLYQAVK